MPYYTLCVNQDGVLRRIVYSTRLILNCYDESGQALLGLVMHKGPSALESQVRLGVVELLLCLRVVSVLSVIFSETLFFLN